MKNKIILPYLTRCTVLHIQNYFYVWVSTPYTTNCIKFPAITCVLLNKSQLIFQKKMFIKNFNIKTNSRHFWHQYRFSKFRTIKSYLENTLSGSWAPFSKTVVLRGNKPQWFVSKKYLIANFVGISHQIKKIVPFESTIKIHNPISSKLKALQQKEKRSQVEITIKSPSLISLNGFASRLRQLRNPNFHTGFGIRYINDIVPTRRPTKTELAEKRKKKI